MRAKPPIHGLMVEFLAADEVLAATRSPRQAGYREMDAYTPYPVEGLAGELGMGKTRMPFVVLVGGLVGAGVGFSMQYFSMAIKYTFNSGGRPYNSWPAFIPIAFELLVLVGGAGGVSGNDVPQRLAAATSSRVQCAAVRSVEPGPLLPLHRGDRSAIRSAGHGRVLGHAQSAWRSHRGAA